MKKIIFLLFVILSVNSYAQISLEDIDFNKLKNCRLRSYVEGQIDNGVLTTNDIKPSIQANTDLSSYHCVQKKYLIKKAYSDVWGTYIKTSPSESWEGRRFSFGMMISPPFDHIVYGGRNFIGLNVGQIVYLELKFLKGIYRSAMAFEIINVDEEEGLIEFSYLKGNNTEGMQQLKFSSTPEGYTQIVHKSFYTSSSGFYVKVLYPYFHKRVINEFHRKLRHKMKRNS